MKNNNLQKRIVQRIQQSPERFIPFDEFMGLALYEPKDGYYMKDRQKIGKEGDFYTTPSASDVFAEVIADYSFDHKSSIQGFSFCEIGAGTGSFAKAWLSYASGIKKNVQYTIVEKSLFHQREIEQIPFPIQQVGDLKKLLPFEGVMFANEWLDAIPCKVVTKKNSELLELVVREKEGRFTEDFVPVTDPDLLELIKKNLLEPKEGGRIEIPLYLDDLFSTMTQKLQSGLLILVDYMYPVTEWNGPELKDGSLRGYQNHQLKRNVLQDPGEMDITYNLPIETVVNTAEQHGFIKRDSVRQDQFLLQNGILDKLQEHTLTDPFHPIVKKNRSIQMLVSPAGMSSYFHVLVFEKKKTPFLK